MSAVEDAIAQLYQARPDEFTQRRAQLVAEAKKNGDAAAAKEIGALRKPSTAAWIVNLLAYAQPDAADRLTGLGDKLRDAQSTLDPAKIRELSSQRRKLIDDLTREAFRAAELKSPAAALRDDVTGTLNAAIADPDVAERLGRLHRAEQWSGFGEIAELAAPKLRVVPGGKTAAKSGGGDSTKAASTGKATKKAGAQQGDAVADAKNRLDTAVATVAAAEQAKIEADDDLDERQSEQAAARMKRDEARRRLAEAEKRLADTEQQVERARKAAREADELVKAARKQQRDARAALDKARRQR